MSHPLHHSISSAKKHGGVPEDYLPIHNWFDETKMHYPDMRHRALRHHAEGIFWCEKEFGVYIVNSDGKKVPVRALGEQHCIEDIGWIPTIKDYLDNMNIVGWMYKPGEGRKVLREIAKDKLDILANTIEQLNEAGFVFIGMDHFSKPDNELAIAQKEGRLHRNFQGYSTQAECDLLAFGISSIGKVNDTYPQNVKTLEDYYHALDRHQLPTMRGMRLDNDDLLRRELIGELMCQFELDTIAFASKHQIDFEIYFSRELPELKELEEAGLLEWQGKKIYVPTKGRLLVRRVAMVFDRHLRDVQTEARYSKVV